MKMFTSVAIGGRGNTVDGMKNQKRAGLRVRTAVKAGGHNLNHNTGLRVKTALTAGTIATNHNAAAKRVVLGLAVKTALKAGRLAANHNARQL